MAEISPVDPRIPLYFLEGMPVRRCVQSGLCCTKAPCAFGEWNFEAHRCQHLVEVDHGEGWIRYGCGIKDQIDALPPERGAAVNPAFGGGCCMPMFNRNREALIRNAVQQLGAP